MIDEKKNNNPERSEEEKLPESQEALDKVRTNPINADDTTGTVGERTTGTTPGDRAGVSDIDANMGRGSRYSRRS